MRQIWGAAGLAALAAVAAACGSPGSSATASSSRTAAASSTATSTPASSSVLLSAAEFGTEVVTNSGGFDLYWFSKDTPTSSDCNGGCAVMWPPVTGPATAGAGVTGKLGVITRSDGTKQATYDGHPLYSFVGDTVRLEATGNAKNASGGAWHVMTVSGVQLSSSATSGSGGSGY